MFVQVLLASSDLAAAVQAKYECILTPSLLSETNNHPAFVVYEHNHLHAIITTDAAKKMREVRCPLIRRVPIHRDYNVHASIRSKLFEHGASMAHLSDFERKLLLRDVYMD